MGDSRSTSFEGMVSSITRGKGVHLLLNSLSDDKLQASVRCLGHWGKLLEIGKYDILQGTPLSMRPMLNNISFEGIDVDRVMNHPESTEVSMCWCNNPLMEKTLHSWQSALYFVDSTDLFAVTSFLGQSTNTAKALH